MFLVGNDESTMRSAATSEFNNDFGQSEQTGFDDMDIDNDDANNGNLDNGKSNRKVHTSSLLFIMIQNVYYHQLNL